MRTDEEIFAFMETLDKVCAKRYGAWNAGNYPNLYVSIRILSILEDILEELRRE